MSPVSDRKKAYMIEYIRENQRQFLFKLSRKTETDMIEWLEAKPNIQAYLKQLIRQDMEQHLKEEGKQNEIH